MGVEVPAQSMFAVHWTHCAVIVSQRGVPPPHWESITQPAPQVKSIGSQIGSAVPQSELARHATH
jgi:hypothetical protein